MVIKYPLYSNLKFSKNHRFLYFSTQLNKNELKPSNIKIKRKDQFNNFFKKKNFDLDAVKQNFGISDSSVSNICKKFGLNRRIEIVKIKFKIRSKISKIVTKLTFKKNLKNKIISIRKFAIEKLKNYKGVRYFLRYPVRGQRTHTNSKTRKHLKNKDKGYLT